MKKRLILPFRAAAALALAFAIAGCETDSASAPLTLRPTSATLRYGQTATFTVEGGYDYTWSLSNESTGQLSNRTGNSVTYTCRASGASNELQVLTVRSFIPGSSSGSSTTNVMATYAVEAQAFIRHESD